MSETLRLYPTVPFNSRRATKDTTLPVGGGPDQKSPVYVPKGWEVNYGKLHFHYTWVGLDPRHCLDTGISPGSDMFSRGLSKLLWRPWHSLSLTVLSRSDLLTSSAVHLTHRRKDLWGEDAEEFKPDRWYGRKAGWEFLPFNGGPRICLGQQHALTTAGFTIVRMLQRFDKLENMETEPIAKHQYTVTTSPFRVLLRLHQAS
jgi:hypothetical protein